MADVKRLVFSVLSFLEDQKRTGGLDDEQVESLEVAVQCLETVYGLSTSDQNQVAQYRVPRNLLDIFNAQMADAESDFSSLSLHEPTPEEKDEAERLKNKGNDFMKAEKFSDAMESYTQAIKLDGKNAVYYCNRAAAYSKLSKHQLAIEDCNRALNIDPSYSKAYGRMGIAFTALNDHESARECYRKALELDPDNQSYQNNLEIAEQKLREAVAGAGFSAGSGAGLPGMGGMDIASLLGNPHLMNMATSMMSNPQMQQMLSSIMTNQSGGEGGLASLLQAGQQLASQIQQQNPELVHQLRSQLGRPQDEEGGNPPPQGEQ